MELPLLATDRLTLRPQREDDLPALLEIIRTPSVALWWVNTDDDVFLRDDLRHDGNAMTIEIDGAVAGWLGVYEENAPDFRYASLDIALAPNHQDKGLGPHALRTIIRWLIDEGGHHRITIDPSVDNTRAIAAYEAVGFRPVGVMRQHWRDAAGVWRDDLLMDLLAGELR